jgi:hypothetical protein
MTVNATNAYLPETPASGLFMTFKTRGGKVSSFEAEPALIMLVNGVSDLVKPF